MTTSIQAAIETAKAAAGALATDAASSSMLATYTPSMPAKNASLFDTMNNRFSVDAFLKLKYEGMKIGSDNTMFDKLELEVDLGSVVYGWGVRANMDYDFTKDRVTSQKGGTWADAIKKAQMIDPKCRGDYSTAQIPFTVIEDIKSKNGQVLLRAGQKIGYTPAVTVYQFWLDFAKRLIDAGINPEAGRVRVTLVSEGIRKNGNEWGTLKITDFSVVS